MYIEGGLECLEVCGVSKDDQVGEDMRGNGGAPDTVEEEDGLLVKVDIV